MHQYFRQALGVKVTLPGAAIELQAEKDRWFLIDSKWSKRWQIAPAVILREVSFLLLQSHRHHFL